VQATQDVSQKEHLKYIS